jgi:hypothetical protein
MISIYLFGLVTVAFLYGRQPQITCLPVPLDTPKARSLSSVHGLLFMHASNQRPRTRTTTRTRTIGEGENEGGTR